MGLDYEYYDMIDNGFGISSNSTTWMIVAFILAVVGGILTYFLFLKKDNNNKFTGFVNYLYEFLSFKKMWLETILKVSYLILTIYITLMSFELIGKSFIAFLLTLVFGNIILRVIYELSLILLTICRNTTEINKKLK
jgi:magnesium-transporting ATPase (P-type)